MPTLDDAIQGWMQQYPFFLPETDRPPPPSQNVLTIPQQPPQNVLTIPQASQPMSPYGVNPWTGDPMPDPGSVLRRTPPPINMASDALQTGQIANPVMRVLGLPQEAIYRAIQPGAVGMLGPQRGELAANVLSMLMPMMMGDIAGRGRIPELAEEPRPTTILPGSKTQPFFPANPWETPWATTALPEMGEQPFRYHGTETPVGQVIDPRFVGVSHGQLYGPGTYTTDNLDVAKGYAGETDLTAPKGPVYQTYESDPSRMKFLNLDKEKVPLNVLQRLDKEANLRMKNFGEPHTIQWEQLGKNHGADYVFNFVSQNPQAAEELMMEMQKEGYTGLTHTGGQMLGGVKHNVKIYWNPERDLIMRPHGFSHIAPPTIGYPEPGVGAAADDYYGNP